jgi:hypothetical protein
VLALLILGFAAVAAGFAGCATAGPTPDQNRAPAATDAERDRVAQPAAVGRRAQPAATAPRGLTLGILVAPAAARVTMITPGSPAAAAGLKSGDLILRFADRDIHSCDEFLQLAPTLPAGTYEAVIRRGSLEFPLSLTLGPVPPPDSGTPRVGVSFRRGAEVQSVSPGFAAEKAGLQAGDLITAANRQPVNNPANLIAFLQAVDPANEVKLTVWRRDHALSITVANAGANLPLRDPASRGALAGALHRAAYTAPASLEQRLAQFNVLQYAFMDPAFGRIVLVGYYDPAYASGPIPYLDLLADAVENPYPAFSLGNPGLGDPVLGQIRATFDNEFARISRDPAYGVEWMKGLILPVLTGSADSEERAALAAKLQAAGSSLAEYDAFMKGQASGFNDPQYFNGSTDFFSHMFAAAGFGPAAGGAIGAYHRFAWQPNPENLGFLAAAAGCGDVLERIRQEVRAGRDQQEANLELLAALYSAMLARMGVPAAEVQRISAGFRAGTISEKAFVDLLDQRWQAIYKEFVTNKLINGMTFSGAALSARYNFPPLRSTLDTFGARRDSVLMGVFFQADYTLKYVTASARAAAQVPGHMTSQAFLGTAENRAGAAAGRTPTTGMIRYWIWPADVECDLLPGNSGVRFRTAALRIGAESLGNAGGDQRGEAFFRQALADYGTQLTGRFDAYARVYPSLHVMRETAKVIALARWARHTGVRLQLAGAQPTRAALPDWSEGFWGMTYVVRPSGDADTMVVWAQGGVKFDQEYGDAWVQSRPAAPEVTNDTLRQLAASTALAEQAAAAAKDGNLEAARDLAERSAQAMTGRIDMSNLPEPVMVPVEGAGAQGFADQAQVAEAAIASVDRNTAGIKQARQNLADAAPLQQTNPQEYARLEEQAHQLQTRSEQNLQRLQGLLQEYRAGSTPPGDVVVDLRGLDPSKPLTVALPPAAPAVTPANPTAPVPAAVAALVQKPPSPEQLRAELARRIVELETLKASLQRLNRSIQMDQQQFQDWEQEAAGAVDRSQKRFKQFVTDVVKDKFFGWAEYYSRDVQPSAQRLEDLKHTKEVTDLNDFAEWADRKDEGFERIAAGVRLLAEQLPISKEAKSAIWAVDKSMESAFDISAWVASWKRINQLDKNSDQFLQAVAQSSERMRQIVERIKEIQRELATAPPPPPASSGH